MPTEAREEARLPELVLWVTVKCSVQALANKLRSSGRAMCPLTTVPFLLIHDDFIFRRILT